MRRNHPSLWLAVIASAAGCLAYAGQSQAQTAAVQEIYQGRTALEEGMVLGGWGSGMATEDGVTKLVGDKSIKIETNGYYSGARLQLSRPLDITAAKNDPFGFLEFVVKFQPGKPKQNQGSAYSGGYPNSGSFSGGPDRGLNSGGFPGYPGSGGVGDAQQIVPDTKHLKVMLIGTDNTPYVASNFPVALFPAQEEGWFNVALPFVAFKGLVQAQNPKIKEIRIFGDAKDTFWIGEIRTTTDDEPINVEPLDELEVAVGEPVEFTASATGGLSPLQYSWDFDVNDGIQEDATGPDVIHVFRKASPDQPGKPGEPQPFLVTLIVRDLGGAKKPVRLQTNVIVNQ